MPPFVPLSLITPWAFGLAVIVRVTSAAAGVAGAEAAGAAVAVMSAAHLHPFETPHPTYEGYGRLEVEVLPDGRLKLVERDEL